MRTIKYLSIKFIPCNLGANIITVRSNISLFKTGSFKQYDDASDYEFYRILLDDFELLLNTIMLYNLNVKHYVTVTSNEINLIFE